MDVSVLPTGILSTSRARELQESLRTRVSLRPPASFAPRLVAGADCSIRKGRDVGHAAIVVVDLADLRVVEEATASIPVEFPYIPGFLSFRELPPLAAAWTRLSAEPDAVIFDAHGLAHPRRFGLACHGGLLFGVPAVGAAKSVLVGEVGPLASERGAQAELVHKGEEVGRAVRTRSGVRPIYVSPGYQIDIASAVELVLEVTPRFRVPEPVRLAHLLCNRMRRR